MNRFRVLAALAAAALLCSCAAPQTSEPVAIAPAPVIAPYRLASGDQLRVIIFGQNDLSNSYSVDGSGVISMPLIGRVRAQGLTTAELERQITTRLKQGYLRDPSVSVEVECFRPFFILGGVKDAGQYSYINGMTVQNAVAVAGGFSSRALEDKVEITRIVDGRSETFPEALSFEVKPGDTITVRERFF